MREVADMGEPNSTQADDTQKLVVQALSPSGEISVQLLLRTGIHQQMVLKYYEVLLPEIKNLTGWKKLGEFKYISSGYEFEYENLPRGSELTKRWCEEIERLGLSNSHAILLYDGEKRRLPAPDYRVYLLRDGRLLYYNGGFHRRDRRAVPVCGDVLDILVEIETRNYRDPCTISPVTEPFCILIDAFCEVLGQTIALRKRLVSEHEDVLNQLLLKRRGLTF